ncbi:hypothetical protein BP00DRAFT_367459 [Aspergillus indologenus CBS 114.80]|uniref:ferric-chelate reductase (NADPH) n=1 Tax=Aspergillus indologenus CBS 114.80 TaxID=1450541 RepID=A0A2V5I8N0_9EURO|nr:hypothetical protein BP00DRAFT_367459 [Aspergillus indologenus CBS 114.80]
MNVLMIYTYFLPGAIGLLFLHHFILFILKFLLNPALFYLFTRYIVLPYIVRRSLFWSPISRGAAFIHILHWSGTLICNILGVNSAGAARSRAGSLALLHLVPALWTPQLSFGAHFFNLSLSAYNRFHRAFGWMALIQCGVHIIFAVRTYSFDLAEASHRNGFIAAITLSSATLFFLPLIRQWAYEIFLKGHNFLSIMASVMIWLHLEEKKGFDAFCLYFALGISVLTYIVYFLRQFYYNLVAGRPVAAAELIKYQDAVKLTLTLARPWKVRGGQYVYLTIPAVRALSFAESHPFSIVWWEEGPNGEAITLSVLAKIESGFTRALASSSHEHLRVWIDGPYGQCIDTKQYDSVILIATGIGVAAQLPYAKELLSRQLKVESEHLKGLTTPKRISIVWELQESHEDWIYQWMDQLLSDDSKTLVLHYTLYILRRADESHGDGQRVKLGRRGAAFYGKPDFRGIMDKELSESLGEALVIISSDSKTRDEVRDLVLDSAQRVDLHEHDFQPEKSGRLWASRKEIKYAGVV